MYKSGFMSKKDLIASLEGWFGYSQWANTYKIRQDILKLIELEEGR